MVALVCPIIFSGLDYVSSLPASVQPYLDYQLDWEHEGVDKDLIEIADNMLHWEEYLCDSLGLTGVDIQGNILLQSSSAEVSI